jgi:hypothetical protein
MQMETLSPPHRLLLVLQLHKLRLQRLLPLRPQKMALLQLLQNQVQQKHQLRPQKMALLQLLQNQVQQKHQQHQKLPQLHQSFLQRQIPLQLHQQRQRQLSFTPACLLEAKQKIQHLREVAGMPVTDTF